MIMKMGNSVVELPVLLITYVHRIPVCKESVLIAHRPVVMEWPVLRTLDVLVILV